MVQNIYCDAKHTKLYYVPIHLQQSSLKHPPVFTADARAYQALLTTIILYGHDPNVTAAVLRLADVNWDNPEALGILQTALQHGSEMSPQLQRAVVLFYSLPIPQFSLPAFCGQLNAAVDVA
jgi:hypothetical protein